MTQNLKSQQNNQNLGFPKLKWECLQYRRQILVPISHMNNAGVVHELSNVCSQLFDLQYKHLQTLKKNKIP